MSRKMTKAGNLRNVRKSPKEQGLDWDAIREARAKRLDEEIARGIDNEETREHQLSEEEQQKAVVARLNNRIKAIEDRPSLTTEGQSRGGSAKGPRVDVEAIVRLYVEENMKPADIGLKLGINPATAIKWLKHREVFDPQKFKKGWKGGERKQWDQKAKCDNGHDLTVEGATVQRFTPDGKKNGRGCVQCQRERSREWWEKNGSTSGKTFKGGVE